MPATSLPASDSERQYDAWHSPDAARGTYFCWSSSTPWSSRAVRPSLVMNVNSDDDAQTRATSSTQIAWASAPPPCPPSSSGNGSPANPASRHAYHDAHGYSSRSSAVAAFGAMRSSARRRTDDRRSSSSGGRSNTVLMGETSVQDP